MTTRRFRGGFRRFRTARPRRRLEWVTVQDVRANELPSSFINLDLLPIQQTAISDNFQDLSMVRAGFTMRRLVVDLHAYIPDPGAVDSFLLWMGVQVASRREIANNSMPLPGISGAGSATADWAFLRCFDVRHRSAVLAGFDPADSIRFHLDTRVMRKLSNAQDSLTLILRNDEASVGNAAWQVCARTLWALP